MKTEVRAVSLAQSQADVLIVPIFEGESPAQMLLEPLDAAMGGVLGSLVASGELRGKRDEVTYLIAHKGIEAGRLLLVGMGARDVDVAAKARRALMVAVRHLRGKRHSVLVVADRPDADGRQYGQAIAEAVELAVVDLSAYKTIDREDLNVEAVTIACGADRESELRLGAERGSVIAQGMNLARDLGNEPGDRMTPRILAERAESMAAAAGLKVEVIDEHRMKELGMGALLGVARGSEEPPRLILLDYEPDASAYDDRITFVGKGITFDSGGISIKPREGMEWMKYDMCGGAAVVGAMQAVARLAPNRRVSGVIAAAENLPSGKAYKPGDVLRSYSGKTIEVLNTDAEGRLVLCDALTYAIERGASHIVDLATLTGACVIALGNVYAGLMGSEQNWVDRILAASRGAGEKIWQLPLDKAYRELIRSDIADIKNLGGRTAGTITAGYFLREFVGATPWAHMDIAGTAWVEDDRPDIARGATGFGVPTLVELVAPASA